MHADSQLSLATSIDQAKWAMQDGRDVPWLLARQAEARPNHPFLIWEPFSGNAAAWTYGEFQDDVRRVAAGLAQRGVEPGDRVMIHLDNSPEFMLAWFACAHLGAVAVSTNTRSVSRDMTYFADKANVVAAITSPQFARLVADSAPSIRFLVLTGDDAGEPPSPDGAAALAELDHVAWSELADAAASDAPDRPTDPTAELGIQFTSGTTSRPKAVLWTHANATWGAETSVAHMRLRADDVTLVMLPMFHTNAQSWSMLTTLWSGGTMVLQPRFSASRFWDVALRHGVTWVSMIPFCVRALMSRDVPEHQMRFWGIGARVPEFEQHFGVFTVGWWGMTETITQGIIDNLDLPGPRRTIGRASPGYDISVRHPDGTPVEPGERGRLFVRGVRGVSMFLRYDGDPEADAAAFDADGWFDTGDMISTDTDGNLFFSDRAKDMLKVGAENVAASEVEAVVMQTGLAVEVAVVGQPHAMLDEVPVAFLIPTDPSLDHAEVERRVIEHCAANLADFKVPRSVFVRDELPRSTIEKIAKNVLRDELPTIER